VAATARRHGQDPGAALDNALADYLDWERRDFEQAIDGIRAGYEDVKAGRSLILEWLVLKNAGDAGLRWFLAREEAIRSPATFPQRCPLARENSLLRTRS